MVIKIKALSGKKYFNEIKPSLKDIINNLKKYMENPVNYNSQSMFLLLIYYIKNVKKEIWSVVDHI